MRATRKAAITLALLLSLGIFAQGAIAAESVGEPTTKAAKKRPPLKLKSEQEKLSYVLGAQTGRAFKAQDVKIRLDIFVRAIQDVLDAQEPALTQDEERRVLTAFRQRMMAKQQEVQQEQASKGLDEGRAFLEANKTKPGVKVLDSGLQYKELREGTGRTATPESTVKVHYRGTFIDGREFDSSYDDPEPAQFVANRVIPGWTEALTHMKEGAKWQLFVPSELAYGEAGRGPIPPNAVLIFEVELIEVVD